MIPLTSVLYVWSVTGMVHACHSVETTYGPKEAYAPKGVHAPKDVNSCHVQIPIVRKKDPSGSFIAMMDSV